MNDLDKRLTLSPRTLAASIAALALTAGIATGAPATPQVGARYTTPDNVAAIVTRTSAIGWPHRFNAGELSGLGRMFSRAVYPLSRHRTGSCSYKGARIFCGASETLSHTFVYLRVSRVWEDGTAAAFVVAVVR